MEIETYFEKIETGVNKAYEIAKKARLKKYDPSDDVEIILVKNMAEKVEGLVSIISPQVKDRGIPLRIIELEKLYGKLDWRVALTIALEVANEKFCKFKDKTEAIEVGIRIGFAYITLGSVSSPLEGFVKLVIKKRKDGGEYFCLYYSGPVRSAGGTGASVSVLIADYIRKKFGYNKYDPTEKEVKRAYTELVDYHERITNLQYFPSEQEVDFLVSNLPVQIDGDPSEKFEVSNYKDLDRIETNKLRNGFCLVIAECLAQKAPKIFAQLQKWGKEFDMGDWDFLNEFVNLQKKLKSKEKSEDKQEKIKPDYTFIKDIVAGRPVLTHPLSKGGFRLRYGRCRNSGLSSMAIHPATMAILRNFIAIGTQLKVERPGKGTALGSCDTIEGPIVKLDNGEVVFLDEVDQATRLANRVKEILFLGDILVNYGDFLNRAHVLIPPGYCEEWWVRELEKSGDENEIGKKVNLDKEFIHKLINEPSKTKITFDQAHNISKKLNIPLHPRFTLHWKDLSLDDFKLLTNEVKNFKIHKEDDYKIITPLNYEVKRILEQIGLPHKQGVENIIIEGDWGKAFLCSLGLLNNKTNNKKIKIDERIEDVLSIINTLSDITIRDKSGFSIGARMGRPEKAKIRKLTGNPHVLFPVGEEGGRLRAVQSALEFNTIYAEFPIYVCENCNNNTIYRICEKCDKPTTKAFFCDKCDKVHFTNKCSVHWGDLAPFYRRPIDISSYLEAAKNKLKLKEIPDLIKGIRGTSNEDHVTENLAKGILRALYNLPVNKDGTIRYDMTETSLTHFKPLEIGTSVEKLKNLGYEKDVFGVPLSNENQILELKVQDVVLPACTESLEEGADIVLFRISKFIDDLLANFYGMERFYNLKSKEDLIGHFILGLAPHTSAGIIGRIIGFSKTQGCYAHPMWHCAIRRDCFSYDTNIPLYHNGRWENVKIGEFVEKIKPTKVVDSYGTLAKDVNDINTLAYNYKTNKIDEMPVRWFTKHTKTRLIKLYLENGKEIKTTLNHKFYTRYNNQILIKTALQIDIGDKLIVPCSIDFSENDVDLLNLENFFFDREDVMVKYINHFIKDKVHSIGLKDFCKIFSIKKVTIYNYIVRDSFPIIFIDKLLKHFNLDFGDLSRKRKLSIKRGHISFPYEIRIDKDFLEIIGFYLAEGYARKRTGTKGFYQVDFAIYEDKLRNRIKEKIYRVFKLIPSKTKEKRLTYSSKILYELFVDILGCGHNAHTKRIPSLFISLPKNKIKHLLRAYFEGDGFVSKNELKVCCDSVSSGLLYDIELLLTRFGIYTRRYTSKREPGKKVRDFYLKKGKVIPKFESTRLIISTEFVKKYLPIGFISKNKNSILKQIITNIKPNIRIEYDKSNVYLKVIKKEILNDEITYCLNVPGHHNVIANGIVSKQCDGDECGIILLMDSLLNFSRKFLPAHRGSTQDAPLVLTTKLIPSEVDDMVFDMDVCWKYPLEFYEACTQFKMPHEIEIETVKKRLETELQYKEFGFTHDTSDINRGVRCSAYKSLPSMMEKVKGQMEIAEMIRAVDTNDVARLVVERHFIRDIRGNLRKFSGQQFRCSKCNEKYRRPPLVGKCLKCDGKIILTISEGSIIKYLKPSLELASRYKLSPYLKQSLELTKSRIESIFGKEKDFQSGLQSWFP